MIPSQSIPSPHRTLGLRENWSQFTLLVLVNAFVGGMVGIERTVLPLLAGKNSDWPRIRPRLVLSSVLVS